MMNKIKNGIANIPIYIGLRFRAISDKFFNLGFNLHIAFKTEAGVKLKEVHDAMENLKLAVKLQAQATKQQNRGDSRLADIINGDNDGQPFSAVIIPKKPTTDN